MDIMKRFSNAYDGGIRLVEAAAAFLIVISLAGAHADPTSDHMTTAGAGASVKEISPATTTTAKATSSSVVQCGVLPTEELSDEQLAILVPEGSPGSVRIAWKTESQEETYGFNILRSNEKSGPYVAVNDRIIPGEGTTNIPRGYCFEDVGVTRGAVYFYQIEEVTNSGTKTIIEGTAGTRIKVKTVDEERAWLKKKAAQASK